MDSAALFSIGYSGFWDNMSGFVDMLKKFDIKVLIDVRSKPYSVHSPEFNKENLESVLNQSGIYYRNYATEFGAQQENRSLYPNGYLDFELFSRSRAFQRGVEKVRKSVAQGYKLAFMCAEKEPIHCHRTILVSKAFSDMGYEIIHILPNGNTKTQHDVDNELMIENPPSFFDDANENALTIAYRKQNEKIGFRLENLK